MRYGNQRLMRIILTKNSTNFKQNKTQHRKAIPKITKRHCDSSLVLGSNRYFTNTPGINAIKTTIRWMRFIAKNVFKYSGLSLSGCLLGILKSAAKMDEPIEITPFAGTD